MRKIKGFTLIEVLFVVIVLAALAGLAIPRINRTIRQARRDTCNANISIINSQVELYRLNTGDYPVTNDDFNTHVLRNSVYFSELPTCPFGTAYTYDAVNDHVDRSTHVH